jgi:putative serine protease PepD
VVEEPDFEGDEPPAFRVPPDPDDRLWRHPSELGRATPATAPAIIVRRAGWTLALASGLTGAVLTIGVLAATGALQRSEKQVVVREAARTAVTSFTTAPGAPDVARIAADVQPAIVRLEVTGDDESTGSGVLFRTDGHVLTNAHVVDDARGLFAVLATGQQVPAHVVGTDVGSDIAVVKLDADGPFPTAVLGTTDGMAVGQPAIAIGSPRGLGTTSVTVGVVSALGRELVRTDAPALLDMIQTDATITTGSSGGALLDAEGSLVGITTANATSSPGLGFATPVDVARATAEDLLALGHVRTTWLGVRGGIAPDGGGVVVASAVADGPAAASGIRAGDVIRRVDDRPIASMSTLRLALRRRHPGDRVSVVLDRAGARRTTVVVLGEHP